MWNDLRVVSTNDGAVRWETRFPRAGQFPRMSGAVANADTVFVSFTSQASGGD